MKRDFPIKNCAVCGKEKFMPDTTVCALCVVEAEKERDAALALRKEGGK